MLKHLITLSTFVASPDDVIEERNIVRQTINEINDYYKEWGYALEFCGWEDCLPERGRPQGIINKLIDDCEIFVGIMGARFGSPTGEADSGTEEEFRHAYKLWQVKGKPIILFYFKKISDIPDAQKDEQLKKVIEFKNEIKKTGLIKEYNDLDDFKQQIRAHLRKIISDRIKMGDLTKIDDSRLNAYIDLLKNQNPDERKRAVQTLGSIRDVRAVKPLIDALNDVELEVKLEIIDALGNFDDRRAIDVLLNLVKDPNSLISQRAHDALKKIDPSLVEPQVPLDEVKEKKDDDSSIFPFSIKAMGSVDTQLIGGSLIITAQLYYYGVPVKLPGIPVFFSIDNPNIASLHKQTTYITDANGQAQIPLTTHNAPGTVRITAKAIINNKTIQDHTEVRIVLWGTIAGTIYDQNGAGILNANVALWYWTKNASTGLMERGPLVLIPENPQLSNDGRTSHVGRYIYYRVPSGDYCVTGERNGHFYFTIIHLEQGTVTQDVIIQDYSVIPFSYSKPKQNKIINTLLRLIKK